jgi:hypothetical protein
VAQQGRAAKEGVQGARAADQRERAGRGLGVAGDLGGDDPGAVGGEAVRALDEGGEGAGAWRWGFKLCVRLV